jgi:phosphatidylserine/phosphatidylglycerophosphate/cardiolipin synthase-like enzyme
MPGEKLSARRIDQVLYDLIDGASREVFLVTFAAARINRLSEVLNRAISRGVQVKLVLEFEETSEGALSYDAIRAFPKELLASATVYFWPTEMRERNSSGRPGKLHAKVAQIDSQVIVSSANLTDDAFTRNLEMGLLVDDAKLAEKIRSYFSHLVSKGILKEFE